MPSIAYNPSKTALFAPQEGLQTCFAEGGTYADEQVGVEAARLAYLQAEKDEAQKATLTQALARISFGAPVLLSDAQTGTQAFATFRAVDGTALIAFRGTQPDELADLKADLNAVLTVWKDADGKVPAGRVHAGFGSRFIAVRGAIQNWLDGNRADRKKLLLCGHSLGAALATLAASCWKPDALVTIGSPRVGDADFVASLAGVRATRFVNCCDLITKVPPDLPPFYVHLGQPSYIDRHGVIQADGDGGAFKDQMQAQVAYELHDAWKPGNVGLRSLADHAPINYVRVLFP